MPTAMAIEEFRRVRESPAIGMVFCLRDLALDEPHDPASVLFARRFGQLHSRLGPLATFRAHGRSASSLNERSGLGWLDRVWLLEGLRTRAGVRLWMLTYANAGKRLVTDGPRAMRSHLRELGHYLRFRLRGRRGDVLPEPPPRSC